MTLLFNKYIEIGTQDFRVIMKSYIFRVKVSREIAWKADYRIIES